uniref:Putative basic tail protein n=1 Tax=Amblyomma parvum TaxID=251391 RepID=A0A023FXQ7_AMBPA
MAILGLLCVFFLQALHNSEGTPRGCLPKKPEKEVVDNCNYYCLLEGSSGWFMGYYVNGTKCKYSDHDDGVCLDIPDKEGCHPANSPDVEEFFQHTSSTDTIATTLPPPKPTTTKEANYTKVPEQTTKPTETNKPKRTKKPKCTTKKPKKKKSKKNRTTTPPPEW